LVNYPIACNDDATKAVKLVLETIKDNLKNIDKK
jgi:ribosomal protein S2